MRLRSQNCLVCVGPHPSDVTALRVMLVFCFLGSGKSF